MRQLKLFQIFDTAENKVVEESFFLNKAEAKKKRVELNGSEAEASGKFRYVVQPGPDHNKRK
jgi:hypothetical protein